MRRLMHHPGRASFLVTLLAALAACAGRSQASPAAPPASDPPSSPPSDQTESSDSISWLRSDSAARTVGLTLVVTRPSGAASALLNGYRAGQAQIVVPVHWTITWDWRNDDAAAPHSLVIMTQREKIPLEGGRAAFSNAMSRMVTAGLTSGQTDKTTFEAEEAGWYWLMCGVPGHALDGEWLELRVSPEAGTGSVRIKDQG